MERDTSSSPNSLPASPREAQRAADSIAVLEALYAWELADEPWREGVLAAAETALGRGHGVGLSFHDVSDAARTRPVLLHGRGISEQWLEAGYAMSAESPATSHVAELLRTRLVWTAGELFATVPAADGLRPMFEASQVADVLCINGLDPSGTACALNVFSMQRIAPTQRLLDQCSRIAGHLAAAYRLRQKLARVPSSTTEGVDAVLEAGGRVEHAEPVAQSREARRDLGAAVQAREWARSRARKTQPEGALRAWRGLVSGRWSLVDRFDRDGKRYILARENAPEVPGLRDLSDRELQVATMAAHGRSNKLIAYELGLSHSTVRVLMARAAAKLGCSSRAQLVSRIQQMTP